MAGRLSRKGVPSQPYHAGLKASLRTQTQTDWMDGITPVICATVSFGMGVDKANVRYVCLGRERGVDGIDKANGRYVWGEGC